MHNRFCPQNIKIFIYKYNTIKLTFSLPQRIARRLNFPKACLTLSPRVFLSQLNCMEMDVFMRRRRIERIVALTEEPPTKPNNLV